jgi:hypothetical protein
MKMMSVKMKPMFVNENETDLSMKMKHIFVSENKNRFVNENDCLIIV